MSIRTDKLPEPSAISNEAIRTAVEALDSAKAAQEQARKDHQELLNTREQALDEDARADEQARSEGKPAKRSRTATAAHDKATEAAEHEHRVCQLAAERAHTGLRAALDQHADQWQTEVEGACAELDLQWRDLIGQLTTLHTRRAAAVQVARKVLGSDHVAVGAISLDRRQLQDIELASGSAGTASVYVEDILGELQQLGQPKAQPEKVERPKPANLRAGENRGSASVEDEIAERRAFLERAKQGTAA